MERCMWRGVLSCYACCMSLSLPPSSSLFLLCLPIIHSAFYGREESEVWQVNAVKACDKLCVCVSPPSLKRRKCWVRLMPAGLHCTALPCPEREVESGFEIRDFKFKPALFLCQHHQLMNVNMVVILLEHLTFSCVLRKFTR